MASTIPPLRYQDPEYQKAHDELYLDQQKRTLNQVLPPGISQKDFDAALERLIDIVGDSGVFIGEALRHYVDPYATDPEQTSTPSAAVCPRFLEQLSGVFQVANEFGVPLWTISRGKNLGYGGPAARIPGSIIVDLHRMNKIIEVNEKLAYAVVEPGVTFTDLYDYCAEHKLDVWPSVASLGWGSVIGKTLDRGQGFIQTGNHAENIAGMEVMTADGSVLRTGQWPKSDSASAHLSKFTFGPSIDGLFLQSNLGIVTKMGIGLTPAPEAMTSCTFSVPHQDDIAAVVDAFGDLRRKGILSSSVYCFNIVEWSSIFGQKLDWWSGDGPIPGWRLEEMQQQLDTGYWTGKFNLYGTSSINQAHYEEVVKIVAGRIPGSQDRFKSVSFSGKAGKPLKAAHVPSPYGSMFVGLPTLWSLPLVKYTLPKEGGVGAHGAYSAIIPLDGDVMKEWIAACRAIYEAEEVDAMCDFFMLEKHAVFVCMLWFDKTDAVQRVATDRILHKLYAAGNQRGFSKYRAHVDHMDLVAEQNDFNGLAYRNFVEQLKDSLDPHGILSPGKQGIWPRKYRHLREVHDERGNDKH